MLLDVRDVSLYYDTALVLRKASISVDRGEFVGLIGPNGAGKTTLLRAISGLVRLEQDTLKGTKLGRIVFNGSITFDGVKVDGLHPHEIAKKGLILCPERGRPFREMTVLDNLIAGGYLCKGKQERNRNLDEVLRLFPELKKRINQASGTLSGGERTMLSIARSLMHSPKLLLIDEPSTGLAPLIKDQLFDRIKSIHQSGLTILLVEQDVSFTFALSNRNYVLSQGTIISEGTDQELLRDETIRKTYLGL